jgi:hypothetical protein
MTDTQKPRRKYTRYASKEEAAAARKAYLREYQKAYMRKDLEEHRAERRVRYFDNPEPPREYARERYATDPDFREKVRADGRAWREANPDKVARYQAKARQDWARRRKCQGKAIPKEGVTISDKKI